MQFVLHAVKDIEYSTDQIYKILNPKGILLFEECSKNDIVINSFFSQWNSYNDQIRTDDCCLSINEWYDLLTKVGFTKDIQFSKDFNENGPEPFIVNAQKHSIEHYKPTNNNYNQIIFMYSTISNSILKIKSIKQLILLEANLTEQNSNNLIIFVKSLQPLIETNFEVANFEFTKISEFVLKNANSFKLLSLTMYSQIESLNYLNSTFIGTIKHFFIYPNVKYFSIDLDNESILNAKKTFKNIEILLNENNFIERVFSIRNNQIKIEKIHQETNISMQSNSLNCNFNKNLDYEISLRPLQLDENQVEIKIMANSINFKDQLIHSKVIKAKSFCQEFSGVVSRIGSKVKNFKVGNKVISTQGKGIYTHIIANEDRCLLMPNNLTFEEASSIISIFITAYYSLFKVTKIKNGMVLLIHSACSGVGLATLNMLKYIDFKGIVLTTVGSKEKENYLIEKYGSLIDGVYSTRNSQFTIEIKKYLKNNNLKGVDFILNMLPGEYLTSSISILKRGGIFIDLTTTHVIKNDLLDLKSMGFHYKYVQVEIGLESKMSFKCLKNVITKIETGKLELPPISIYGIDEIKTVFEQITLRKHIGKFVVNYGENQNFHKQIESHKFKNTIVKEDYSINENLGLALNIIKWILKCSKTVKDLIVFSKSKIHWELEFNINYYQSIGIHYKTVDVGNSNDMKKYVDEIYSNVQGINPVESIFHCAFLISDENLKDLKIDNFIEAHNAKSHGAINLHNLSIEYKWNLKNFILNSSMLIIYACEVQLPYELSNYLVEGLARYRKSIGLCSTVIKWVQLIIVM
ncbi:hypothetical protein ACTFIY_007076 [Dictyostelium cf. discoideum]